MSWWSDNVTSRTSEWADKIQGGIDDLSGKTGEKAAGQASEVQQSALLEQLNYLKEINALPQEYKEQALTKMNELYSGGPGTMPSAEFSQSDMISQAKNSPLYNEMIGNLGAGEDAIMRNAAATGGLRSGNVQGALADYNTSVRNQALTQSYGQVQADQQNLYNRQMGQYGMGLQGLQGLAGLDTGQGQIAQATGDIGNVQAQGIMNAASSRTAGTGNILNSILGLGAIMSVAD